MNLIELHILQSYPVSCLNRDDVGAPKSAVFGGVTRARLSSQCLKRAVRTFARDEYPEALFNGVRSRRLVEPFLAAFEKAGLSPEEAQAKTDLVREALSKIDKNKELVTTAVFLSPCEIEQIAAEVTNGTDPKKAAKKASRLDAADIALFGRMIANDASLTRDKVLEYVKRNAVGMSLLIITSEPNCQGFKIERWGEPDRQDTTLSGLWLVAEKWADPDNQPF